MPPYSRSSSGFRGICVRPSGVFYAEIRSIDMCPGLEILETTRDAAHGYDATAWHLRQPRTQMNFNDVFTCEQAHDVVPPSHLITRRTSTSSEIGSAAP
ncbi:putative AP2 protein [Hordeum vulgare]|nr:putative AP2 protein [Hordeum vulgare]